MSEQPPQSNPYAADKSTSGLNVLPLLALILAFFLPFASIVLGHISLSQMKKGTMSVENRGLALAGLILGYVLTALAVAGVVVYFWLMAMIVNGNTSY
ncbi:MAG: hypothetical protein RLZZ164_913 [Actinomycetota bacterium]|jgi:hypothetical protein